MKVAILGGTGSFGRALAGRLAALGEDDVVIGSRDAARAQETAVEIGGDRVSGAANEEAVAGADLAVLAVKADGALETARTIAGALGDTPLLSVASAIEFHKGAGMFPDPEARSLAERVQDVVRAPVVAGLHSVAAANLAEAPDEDALVCGDDPAAKELALELAGKLVSGRALDAGPLASARALEGLTAVIVNLNRRYKAHAGLRVTGIEL
jgi:8-hydroxy-5-deazaflavin:NADPH oxidoreductase